MDWGKSQPAPVPRTLCRPKDCTEPASMAAVTDRDRFRPYAENGGHHRERSYHPGRFRGTGTAGMPGEAESLDRLWRKMSGRHKSTSVRQPTERLQHWTASAPLIS